MTTETILTDATQTAVDDAIADALGDAYDCLRVWSAWSYGTMGPDDFSIVAEDSDRLREISDAAIRAVLQSDQIRNMQGMADCMHMVRQELIEAGVVNERVPPMMVANAVLAAIQALRKDAARLDKLEADYFEPVEGGIRKHIDEAMEQQV